ncbi:UNVERIFIED_CONTAM: hypothetical protein FKN15_071027, partial [Acipenser sinensis]
LADAFKRTVEHFGKLDIVINNAGINNEKNWEKTIEVNLTSVVKGTYLGLEHMSKEHGKQGGVIINVSSMAAFLHSPHQPVYTATKYGVVGFTRAIAEASEIENYGVRINVLCPAFVDTPLLQSIDQEEKMGKFYKHKDEIKHRMDIYGILNTGTYFNGGTGYRYLLVIQRACILFTLTQSNSATFLKCVHQRDFVRPKQPPSSNLYRSRYKAFIQHSPCCLHLIPHAASFSLSCYWPALTSV